MIMPDTFVTSNQLDAVAACDNVGGKFHNARLHRLVASSKRMRSLTIGFLVRLELAIMSGHKDTKILELIRAARNGRESLLSANEAFTLYSLARGQRRLDGVMAEVG